MISIQSPQIKTQKKTMGFLNTGIDGFLTCNVADMLQELSGNKQIDNEFWHDAFKDSTIADWDLDLRSSFAKWNEQRKTNTI